MKEETKKEPEPGDWDYMLYSEDVEFLRDVRQAEKEERQELTRDKRNEKPGFKWNIKRDGEE